MNAYCDLNKITGFCLKNPWYFNCDVFDFSKWEIFLVIRSIVSWTNWTALLYHIGLEITRPQWPRHFSCYIQIFEMTDLLVSSIAHRLITTWLSYLPGGVGWGCSSTFRNYSFRYPSTIPRNPLFKINMTPAKESPLKKFTQVKLLRFIHWTQRDVS